MLFIVIAIICSLYFATVYFLLTTEDTIPKCDPWLPGEEEQRKSEVDILVITYEENKNQTVDMNVGLYE